MDETQQSPSIVVVGMGPVGMSAALGLARRGYRVTVLEAGSDLAVESRASTFHPSSLEILDGLGVADELIEIGLVAPAMQYRGSGGEIIAHFDMTSLAEEAKFPFRVQCEQSKLTRLILPYLEADPRVTLRFDAPVDRVEVGTDCAYVYLEGDGFEPSYRADWLIGADGANSAVRRSLGIAFEGVTYPERFLVASTTHDFRDDFEDLADINYVYDPEDWGVLLRTPDHWRALFPIPHEETDEEAVQPERIERRLQGVAAQPEPYPVIHRTLYKVHQRLASTFAEGRVLLAGDAAHINNPLGGMGMNSGLHDAEAAIEVIDHALAGGDASRAVATYAKVRKDAAALDVQRNTQKNYEEMKETDARNRAATKDTMAAIAADPVLLRRHLRRTSLLDSLRLSRRRMRYGLGSAGTTPDALAPGTLLSDSLRDGPRGPEGIRHIRTSSLPSDPVVARDIVAADSSPVILELAHADLAPARIQLLEWMGAAGVVAPAGATELEIGALAAARSSMMVVVPLEKGCFDAAGALVAAGADALLLHDGDLDSATRVSRAVPSSVLAFVAEHPAASTDQLHLAGVGLVLPPAHDLPSHANPREQELTK